MGKLTREARKSGVGNEHGAIGGSDKELPVHRGAFPLKGVRGFGADLVAVALHIETH